MAGSPDRPIRAGDETPEATILRFSRGPRVVHWAHAVPFLLLLLTGLSLYVPSIKALNAGGYRLLPLLHVIIGIAFILSPLPVYFSVRDRAALWEDIRRLFRVEPGDVTWLRYAVVAALGSRVEQPPTEKFNLGQKLNAGFSVLVTLGLMASGAVLAVNFFTKRVFSAQFVERVFPLHDLFMLVSLPVLAAHIYLGSLNPATRESLKGITGGRVSRSWARAHHSRWVDEMDNHET
jgi:formate dehydrogenase subunit gamma